MRRPAGITFLAIVIYFQAAWLFAIAIASLVGPKALDTVGLAFAHSTERPDLFLTSPASRGWFALFCVAASVLIYFVARGLWRLKNWARVLVLILSILDLPGETGSFLEPIPTLLSGRIVPMFWRHSYFVTSGILYLFLSFLATVIVLGYLVTRPVKTAFLARPTEWRWLLAVGVLGLLSFGYDIYKSGPEIKAVRYHLRHGDQVTVNGVTFPVYDWHAPEIDPECPGFTIEDSPGPLRPIRSDRSMFMTIEVAGYKQQQHGLTVDQLVHLRLQSYMKAGYTDLSTFHLQIARESLSCVKEHLYASSIYCYGDGPIYSTFFTGSEESLTRFNQMMAEAKQSPAVPSIIQKN